jgi:hypothetical protein
MTINHLRPSHRSVVNMIGHALTLENDVEVWNGLSVLLEARLTAFERGCLAATTLSATDDEQFRQIVEAAVPARLAGQPLPLFLDLEAEARWWADLASPAELRAWLTACFVRLPVPEKISFLAAAKRRAAA